MAPTWEPDELGDRQFGGLIAPLFEGRSELERCRFPSWWGFDEFGDKYIVRVTPQTCCDCSSGSPTREKRIKRDVELSGLLNAQDPGEDRSAMLQQQLDDRFLS